MWKKYLLLEFLKKEVAMRMHSLIEKLSRLLMKRSQKILYPYSVTKDLETCGKVWFNGCRIDWVRSLIFSIKISFLWLNEDRNVWPLSQPNLTRIIMSLTSLKIGSLKCDPRWNDGHVEMMSSLGRSPNQEDATALVFFSEAMLQNQSWDHATAIENKNLKQTAAI